MLGVSDNKLLLDGVPLDPGQAERSFAQLLTAAGLEEEEVRGFVTANPRAALTGEPPA